MDVYDPSAAKATHTFTMTPQATHTFTVTPQATHTFAVTPHQVETQVTNIKSWLTVLHTTQSIANTTKPKQSSQYLHFTYLQLRKVLPGRDVFRTKLNSGVILYV